MIVRFADTCFVATKISVFARAGSKIMVWVDGDTDEYVFDIGSDELAEHELQKLSEAITKALRGGEDG
ncbi:hypothetical protein DQK91_19090 [Oceanidesulfovibrio marinus]|uniref:Uncharacterized protein n=1 Tax=Oceanidesulfovibrio marinus TaxID=370038 RepID=A0A6P1ZD89_9BACT|nr:hypothetical protein DQK91_19090 [Oceanidesulfovibrio marinus]